MKTTQTLSMRSPVAKSLPAPKQRIEHSLVGKSVILQTRSPTRITGTVVSFDSGWVVIDGTERRWRPDGSLSDSITRGIFTLERAVIAYVAEVV